jgi:hypothetical protein
MNLHLRKYLLPLSLGVTLLSSLPVTAMAVTERVETAPFIPAVVPNASGQFHPLAKNISKALSHIAVALNTLHQHTPAAAKKELEQSQAIISSLEKDYGTGTLSLWISATHRTLNANSRDAYLQSGMRDLHRLETVKKELRQGRLASAEELVDKIEFPLVFAEIDIPLQQLQDGVTRTLKLIDQGKSVDAEKVLEQTQVAARTDASLFGGYFNS